MSSSQQAVTTAISVLLSTTPEDYLGRLLRVCLAAKVDGDTKAKAQELFDKPDNLAYWLHEIIGADEKYTEEEWLALGDMDLTDVQEFVAKLMPEVEALKV